MSEITGTSADPGEGVEFLVFDLGGELYGVDILKVQEIRSFEKTTRIANAPPHISGVINLRGVIVPIVDARLRLNLPSAEYTPSTVVIVLLMAGRTVGMVVDGVSDVITLRPDQIKAPPKMATGLDSQCLTGLGAFGEQMLLLVDIEKFMLSEDRGVFARLAA